MNLWVPFPTQTLIRQFSLFCHESSTMLLPHERRANFQTPEVFVVESGKSVFLIHEILLVSTWPVEHGSLAPLEVRSVSMEECQG